jgi:outer membrane lipoprotein-sorting protein
MPVSSRMIHCFWGMALAITAVAGTPATAQTPAPREVLLRSLEQEGTFDYAGTQSTLVKNGAKEHQTDQIVQFKHPNQLRIEYLAPPRLRGDVVIDDGVQTRRFVHKLGVIEQGPAVVRAFDPKRRRQIERALRSGQLQVTMVGEEVVAFRRAWVIEVTPANPNRPRRKL